MCDKTPAELLITCLNSCQPERQKQLLAQLEPAQWDELATLAIKQRVEPLLYHCVKQHQLIAQIPQPTSEKLRWHYRENTARNLQIYGELGQLLEKLNEQNIPVILLKGAYLARAVYPTPTLRYMADYDILVREDDLSAAIEVVMAAGYQAEKPIRVENKTVLHHLPPFRKENGIVDLELHWTIVQPTHPQKIQMAALWERARPFAIGRTKAFTFCPEDLLLHLCFHAAYHHLFMQGLRPLYDVAKLVERFGSSHGRDDQRNEGRNREVCDEAGIDWHVVYERSILWNCSRGTYLILYLAHSLLNAAIPAYALEMLRPDDISSDVIDVVKTYLFTAESEIDDGITENFMRITGKRPLKEKLQLLYRRLFISRQELANAYGLPSNSLRLYLYYPRRYGDFLANCHAQMWAYLRGIQTSKQEINERNFLINWMEQREQKNGQN